MKKPESPSLLLNLRFALIVILSACTLVLDLRSSLLSEARYYFESAMYPILAFADSPRALSRVVRTQFKSNAELAEENERLSGENYLQRADLLRLRTLEQENAVMRKLLNSPLQETPQRMFAEVIDVATDPYLKRVVINRGTSAGVYEGMPVITDTGIVGQVIEANYNFSRVLLLTDPSSSIPVVDLRNQIRVIANGTGAQGELLISNVPRSISMEEGDVLVTSGLGGIYPEGYPVAVVTSVGFSQAQAVAEVKARPLVDFDRMRYVLVFWYQQSEADGSSLDRVKPKERSDSKVVLRQRQIKELIETLTDQGRQRMIAADTQAEESGNAEQ